MNKKQYDERVKALWNAGQLVSAVYDTKDGSYMIWSKIDTVYYVEANGMFCLSKHQIERIVK
jgi:hypothetical protein